MTDDAAPSITCPRCGSTSYHPGDVESGYCVRCHWWTSDPTGMLNSPEALALAEKEGLLEAVHACEHPDAEAGVLWRCDCGALWQLSIAQGRWVAVSARDEATLRAIFGRLP